MSHIQNSHIVYCCVNIVPYTEHSVQSKTLTKEPKNDNINTSLITATTKITKVCACLFLKNLLNLFAPSPVMYPSSPPLPPPLSPGGALAAPHPVSRERQPGRNVAAAPDPLQLCNNRIPEEIRICKAWHLNWCWPGLQYTPSPFYINCSSVFSHKRQTEGERVGCTGTFCQFPDGSVSNGSLL